MSGRVYMQSANAKRPKQWLVKPKTGTRDVYTLSPYSGKLDGVKLAYSKACTFSTPRLAGKGLLSWKLKFVYGYQGKSRSGWACLVGLGPETGIQ